MGKDPSIKIRGQGAAVIHITAIGIVVGIGRGGFHDLMVGKDVFGLFCTFNGLFGHLRLGTIGTNHKARTHTVHLRLPLAVANLKMDTAHTIHVLGHALKGALLTVCTMALSTLAQPLVKLIAVDHSDKPTVDGDIDAVVFGRDHSGFARLRHQQVVWDLKVFDQARRNRATTGLDSPQAVKHQDPMPFLRQIIGCGCSRRPSPDHHHVIVCIHLNIPTSVDWHLNYV